MGIAGCYSIFPEVVECHLSGKAAGFYARKFRKLFWSVSSAFAASVCKARTHTMKSHHYKRLFLLGTKLSVVAAFLLPMRLFADPSLGSSLMENWGNNSLVYSYGNDKTAPPGTSLSDSATNGDPWSSITSSVSVFYGSGYVNNSGDKFPDSNHSVVGFASANTAFSWNSQMTINTAGLEGQAVTARVTVHLSGDISGSGEASNGAYSVSLAQGFGGQIAGYGASWSSQDGWYIGDGPPTFSFTADAQCFVGQPCEIAYVGTLYSGAGGANADSSSHVNGNFNVSSGSVEILDPYNDNAPINFTMVGDAGSGAGQVTPAGGSYAGFTVTNSAPDRLGSTFSLLDGTASHDTNVTANFVAPPPVDAASDAVELQGTDGDMQVVQISWDPAKQQLLGPLAYFELCFLPVEGGAKWESALLGNYNGGQPTFFDRAYNPDTDFHLGYYGIDSVNHVAWAVINHNSLFAAANPFDLVSAVSRKTHAAAGTFDVNLPLTGTPGVECRSGGPKGNHTLVFTFKSNLVSGAATVTAGTGRVVGTPVISGNSMTINLTGVTDAQTMTITLQNMKDVANQVLPDTPVSISFLLGDISANGKVDKSDYKEVNARKGRRVNASNFRDDINLSGVVDKPDIQSVRANNGHHL